jgi:3,4-dihydroxy 2-butanone 4-phosphate synthase/GTP cyclohydrolase II
MIGDVFQLTEKGKGPQLHAALETIGSRECGIVVYINKLRSGGGLLDELRAYKTMGTTAQQALRHGGVAHPMDSKDYGIGAQILRQIGAGKLELLTDSPRKTGSIGYGLEIVSTTPLTKGRGN